MAYEVERLRQAIREFGAPSDVVPGEAGWQDVAVWFGSLLMLGPRWTRGVGAFASVALVSRVWSRRQFRVEDRMRHVLRASLDLVAEDLEDRAAVEASVDELVDRVNAMHDRFDGYTDAHDEVHVALVDRLVGVEHSIGEIGEAVTSLEASRGAVNPDVVSRDDVREYLDGCIGVWRDKRDQAQRQAGLIQARRGDPDEHRVVLRQVRQAADYIDAFQSVRTSLLGEVLPEDADVARGEKAMARDALSPFPYPDGDVLVLGPEVIASGNGAVISWAGQNYYVGVGGDPEPVDAEPVDPGAVALTFEEAVALRSAVLGDRFNTAPIDSALNKIELVERARSPQSDEEQGPPRRVPSSGQGPAGSGPER